jgi:hypothetical protein
VSRAHCPRGTPRDLLYAHRYRGITTSDENRDAGECFFQEPRCAAARTSRKACSSTITILPRPRVSHPCIFQFCRY